MANKKTILLLSTALMLASCSVIGYFKKNGAADNPSVLKVQQGGRDIITNNGLPEFGKTSFLKPESFVLSYRSVAEIDTVIGQGEASWYGPNFHGNTTASGERYDMRALTAAHPSLPFNTRLWVENTSNGRGVLVRINDRGPYAGNRIIDLSSEAARALGITNNGVTEVKLYRVSTAADNLSPFTIRLGALASGEEALAFAESIGNSRVEVINDRSKKRYGVFYGRYKDREEAFSALRQLEENGYSGLVKKKAGSVNPNYLRK